MRNSIKYIILLCYFHLMSSYSFAQENTSESKLKISHLTGDFYVYTTYRDYEGSPFSSNGMYLITNKGTLIIDSPWDTTQFQALLDSIKIKHNQEAVMFIATHSHDDRTGAINYFRAKGISTFTSAKTDKICEAKGEKRAEFVMSGDSVFNLGNYRFETYFPGAGHTSDNMVIWFEKEKILYGGCFIKSIEAINLGYLGDANTHEWPNSLHKILKKYKKPTYVIPGHQSWLSNKSILHTIKLLKKYHSFNK